MDVIASLSLVFDILARDKASSEFKKVGDAAEDAGKRGGGAISSLSGSLKGIGAAFAGSAIVAGLGKTISAASDLNETVNKSNVIFGANSREIQKWATGASKNLGLSKGAALEAAAGFGNMFSQLGFTGDAATDMSTQVVQLSADLGSFNNLPTAEVADMMSAAFRGEYDSLQRLIPNINAARVEQEAMAATGKANAKELTAQEKATAVLAIVQRDGASAAGDFAKTSDGLANSSKIAAAQFEDLQAEIGQKFLPAAQAAMGFVSDTAIPAVSAFADGAFSLAGAFADLPGPVKLAAGAAVAWAIAGDRIMSAWSPVKGAFSGLRGTMSSFNEALGYARANGDGLGTVLRSTASYAGGQALDAFKRLGRAIGPELGIGLAVVTVSELVSGYKRLTQASDEAKAAAEGLAGALTLTDAAADRRAVRDVIEDVDGLVEVLDAAGVSSRDAVDGLLGQADAQARVTRALQEYIATHRTGQAGGEAADARELMLAYEELATGYGTAAGAARFFGDEASGAGKAADQAASPTSWLDKVVGGVSAISTEAAENVNDLRDELTKLRGGTVDAAEAQINLADSIRDASKATDDLSGSVTTSNGKLNLQSEAGGAAYRALVDVADASNDVIDSMRTQGKSAEQMAKRDGELRVSFIKTAIQMGIGKKEAKKLADQILGVPEDRETKFNADTKTANDRIDNLQKNIDNTTGKTITVQVRAAGRFIINPNGGLQEFWKGGYTGTGGMFDVKGLVHGDEFVVPKSRVRALGGPRAVAAAVGMGGDFGAPVINLIHDTRSVESDMEKLANAVKSATPKGGIAGSGSVGGGWQSIYNWVKARIPQARVNSSYRPGDPGYHGLGKAVDFGYGSGPGGFGSAGLALINRTLHDGLGRNLAELIYDGYGDDRPDLKNGRPLDYGQATRFEHRNHVHAAVYDQGGLLPPGLTLAYNGTGKNEQVITNGGLTGLEISGRLVLDEDGFARIVDGRIVDAFEGATSRGRYNP